jgi:hypothetical protein
MAGSCEQLNFAIDITQERGFCDDSARERGNLAPRATMRCYTVTLHDPHCDQAISQRGNYYTRIPARAVDLLPLE